MKGFRITSFTKDNDEYVYVSKDEHLFSDDLEENEVFVRMLCAPINPSDLGALYSGSTCEDMQQVSDNCVRYVPPHYKVDRPKPLTSGIEGCGEIIKTRPENKSLMGKVVSFIRQKDGTYGSFARVNIKQAIVFDEKFAKTPEKVASCFVNPMTALGMVETMKREGHKGLMHTAAASKLGQMLVKICVKDKIPLVNIVRSQKQVELLTSIGAKYVVNSSDKNFQEHLEKCIDETRATICFDAIGGGTLVNTIISSMENVGRKRPDWCSIGPYGTNLKKRVYIYGMLDPSPTILERRYGFSYNIGGWLLGDDLFSVTAPERMEELRNRIRDEIETTFETEASRVIKLDGLVDMIVVQDFAKPTTGVKILVRVDQANKL